MTGRPRTTRRLLAVSALAAACAVASAGCGGPTKPSPSPTTTIITFSGLTTNRTPVGTYTESNFNVSSDGSGWVSVTTYGNPAPFIEFFAAGGTTVVGQVAVFASGHLSFRFQSVDLYSSVTRIPYEITGIRNAGTVFTLADTLPNTFGNFRTVLNPQSGDLIDTLIIRLTNSLSATPSPGLTNPMGLDNVALAR